MNFKKAALLMGVILAMTNAGYSQEEKVQQVEDVSKVTFLSPGLSYERQVGRRSTLMGQAFISPYFSLNYSDALGWESEFYLEPALTIQYRYYYNYANRQEKGLRTERNSMNYVAPVFRTAFSKRRMSNSYYTEPRVRSINSVGFIWGLQRNLPKRFSLDFSAGLGYLFTTGLKPDEFGGVSRVNVGQLTTMGGLTLGFWLNRAK